MTRGSGGGGYGSRPHVEKSVKTGSGNRGVRESGAESIGKSYGSHITNKSDTGYRGPKFHSDRNPPMSVPFGNEKALAVGKGGCGTDRDIHERGSQGMQGKPAAGSPRPAGRGILTNE
jgi:hypothetical protein